MEDTEILEKIENPKYKKTTFGQGLVKGLGITMRHLLSRSVTIQYPDEKDVLPTRSRGVIALKEENCTVCMLCARECPDWCIYIEGHKESREPAQPGKRAKKFNVLDRFAIDYALCMYCGICVEVCPYDALFWSPEYEYADHDITELTHEMERLTEWMYTVLPPEPLDEGARGPEYKTTAGAPAAMASPPPAATPVTQAPPPPSAEAVDVDEVPKESGNTEESLHTPEAAAPPAPALSDEEAERIGQEVYEAEIAKGADPRVAEARKKAAIMRAKKGTKGPQS